MKTTVKEFILSQMTDANFEKLVDALLMSDDLNLTPDLEDAINHYVTSHEPLDSKKDTFNILHEIKQVTANYDLVDPVYKSSYVNGEDLIRIDGSLSELNKITKVNMPGENESSHDQKGAGSGSNELGNSQQNDRAGGESAGEALDMNNSDETSTDVPISEREVDEPVPIEIDGDDLPFLESDDREKEDGAYTSFDELNLPFVTKDDKDLMKNDIDYPDETNYKEYIHQERNKMALGLANFLYEIIHYTTDDKMENQFEEFAQEPSHVKIDQEDDGYYVYFLVGYRSPHQSKGARFLDSEIMYEYFQEPAPEYMLDPFTNYLNEELIVPNLPEEILFEILEQLMYTLTQLGYTKFEQIASLESINKNSLSEWEFLKQIGRL